MELVRVVSHNTHKRMVSCLQGHIGADAEKRHVRRRACSNENINWIKRTGSVPVYLLLTSLPTQMFKFSLFYFSSKLSTVGRQPMISLLCFLPHTTKKKKCTTVRTTPLYRKWAGKNHWLLLPLSGPQHHLLHFPFRHLSSLFTVHDTAAFGILWEKQDVEHSEMFLPKRNVKCATVKKQNKKKKLTNTPVLPLDRCLTSLVCILNPI